MALLSLNYKIAFRVRCCAHYGCD